MKILNNRSLYAMGFALVVIVIGSKWLGRRVALAQLSSTIPSSSRYVTYTETSIADDTVRGSQQGFNAVRGDGTSVRGTYLKRLDGQTYLFRRYSSLPRERR